MCLYITDCSCNSSFYFMLYYVFKANLKKVAFPLLSPDEVLTNVSSWNKVSLQDLTLQSYGDICSNLILSGAMSGSIAVHEY